MSEANLGARRVVGALVAIAAVVALGFYLFSDPDPAQTPATGAPSADRDSSRRRGGGGGGGGGGGSSSDSDSVRTERAAREGSARRGRSRRPRALSGDGGVGEGEPAPRPMGRTARAVAAAMAAEPERGIIVARPRYPTPQNNVRPAPIQTQWTRLNLLRGLLEDQLAEVDVQLQDAQAAGNEARIASLSERRDRLLAQRPELADRLSTLEEQGAHDPTAESE